MPKQKPISTFTAELRKLRQEVKGNKEAEDIVERLIASERRSVAEFYAEDNKEETT